jgi:predicted nucleic acid-binding protein
LEYEASLLRHAEQLGLSEAEVTALVDYLCSVGVAQQIHFLWRPALHDPRDEFVLELAVAAGCQAIVTHNTRDFAGADRFGVEVLTPGKFLRRLEVGL